MEEVFLQREANFGVGATTCNFSLPLTLSPRGQTWWTKGSRSDFGRALSPRITLYLPFPFSAANYTNLYSDVTPHYHARLQSEFPLFTFSSRCFPFNTCCTLHLTICRPILRSFATQSQLIQIRDPAANLITIIELESRSFLALLRSSLVEHRAKSCSTTESTETFIIHHKPKFLQKPLLRPRN